MRLWVAASPFGVRPKGRQIEQRTRAVSDRLTSALLAALNESTEIKESDWLTLERALRGQLDRLDSLHPTERNAGLESRSENRFAATVCSGMAKIRASL